MTNKKVFKMFIYVAHVMWHAIADRQFFSANYYVCHLTMVVFQTPCSREENGKIEIMQRVFTCYAKVNRIEPISFYCLLF